jgi:hypothetical protein
MLLEAGTSGGVAAFSSDMLVPVCWDVNEKGQRFMTLVWNSAGGEQRSINSSDHRPPHPRLLKIKISP